MPAPKLLVATRISKDFTELKPSSGDWTKINCIKMMEAEDVPPKSCGLQETGANNTLKTIFRLNIDSSFPLEAH